MTAKTIKQIIKEEIESIFEDTAIVTQRDVAVAKFMALLAKYPSLGYHLSKLKVEESGSFASIVVYDDRGNKVELVRTPTKEIAHRIMGGLQEDIVKLVKIERQKIGDIINK